MTEGFEWVPINCISMWCCAAKCPRQVFAEIHFLEHFDDKYVG